MTQLLDRDVHTEWFIALSMFPRLNDMDLDFAEALFTSLYLGEKAHGYLGVEIQNDWLLCGIATCWLDEMPMADVKERLEDAKAGLELLADPRLSVAYARGKLLSSFDDERIRNILHRYVKLSLEYPKCPVFGGHKTVDSESVIQRGGDLEHAVASEWANYAAFETMALHRATRNLIMQLVPLEANAPIVYVEDGSSSMDGYPSEMARSLGLALWDVADALDRPFSAIVFGTEFDTYNKSTGKAAYINHDKPGITNVKWPLAKEAVDVIKREGFNTGDVVFASDGEYVLTPELEAAVALSYGAGIKLHQIDAGDSAYLSVAETFHNIADLLVDE